MDILYSKYMTTSCYLLLFFLFTCKGENYIVSCIHVDEDGALVHSLEFTEILKVEATIMLETTGGYTSFLNGKEGRHHCTIAKNFRSMLKNSGHNKNKWCYAAETAANIYHGILHLAINTSPYYAWYNIHPSIFDSHIWGCTISIKDHAIKKSEDCTVSRYNMGFTKSRLLSWWWDPKTDKVKHAYAVKFNEYNVCTSKLDLLSPSTMLLHGESLILFPECNSDVSDHPHLASSPFLIAIHPLPLPQ